MNKLTLHKKVLISLVLAFTVGLLANSQQQADLSPAWIYWLIQTCEFVGKLFLNALKMVVIPLVLTSVICGVSQIAGERDFGRLGLKTLLLYSLTGILAVATGLFCVNLIQPGLVEPATKEAIMASQQSFTTGSLEQALETADNGWANLIEIFHRMLPPNLFSAAAEGQLLGLICFGLLFGFFLGRTNPDLRTPQVKFWQGLQEIILKLTHFILGFAPVGIFGLVTPTLAKSGLDTFWLMGGFALTVFLALGIHALITLPVLLRIFGGIRSVDHFRAMSPALLTAFSTASSSATLPVTMKCANDRVGISKKITGFTLPLGATLNMDGTALFECVVVIFLAQFFGIEMGWTTQFFVVLLALLTSVGVAGIPSASLVAILVILQAVGFDDQAIATGVGMIYVVDRILDMSRTMINVLGDSCAAAIIGKSEGESGYYPNPSYSEK
ncbi:MAG: dicarboxylate/amino acid:cation symporter [Opitutae bacterium]